MHVARILCGPVCERFSHGRNSIRGISQRIHAPVSYTYLRVCILCNFFVLKGVVTCIIYSGDNNGRNNLIYIFINNL